VRLIVVIGARNAGDAAASPRRQTGAALVDAGPGENYSDVILQLAGQDADYAQPRRGQGAQPPAPPWLCEQ
jgi:hypothetical protein